MKNKTRLKENAVEVTYALENSDYLRFNKFVINRTPALKRQMLLRFLGLPALIAVEVYFIHLPPALYLPFVLVFSAAWIAYLWWAQQRAVTVQAQLRPGVLGLHTVSLQPDGLYNQTTILDTRVKWQNITEVADSPQMIVLFLSPRYGFIVPKHAFADPAEASAFLETAQAYRRSASDGTLPSLPARTPSWPPAPQRML